jgi:hypothetical protein
MEAKIRGGSCTGQACTRTIEEIKNRGSSASKSRAETIEMLTDRIHATPVFPDSAGLAA